MVVKGMYCTHTQEVCITGTQLKRSNSQYIISNTFHWTRAVSRIYMYVHALVISA